LPGSELLAVLLVSGLPDRLVSVLKATKVRQAAERLALGCGAFDYVVSNEAGEPYSPAVLSRYWRDAVKAAGVRHIRFHAARHTCATLMHLSGVPVGRHRGVDRAQGRQPDDAAVRAFTG
jgi:integrase